MKSLAQASETAADNLPSMIEQGQLCSARQKNLATLTDSPEDRKQLTNLLFQCFDALKVYGKEPEQLENVNAMFQMVLAGYPYEKIRQAFTFYLKFNSDLPAPADIAMIIERGNKPPLDRSVYISLTKKDAYSRTSDEWSYINEYENFQLRGQI